MEPDYQISFSNRQQVMSVHVEDIKRRVTQLLELHDVEQADISIVFLNNAAIHDYNRQYLNHDEPTDVITFSLDDDFELADATDSRLNSGRVLSGEILVSAEMAADVARELDWTAENELLLYIAHGILHLLGFDDLTDEARPLMRKHEQAAFNLWGIPMTAPMPTSHLED